MILKQILVRVFQSQTIFHQDKFAREMLCTSPNKFPFEIRKLEYLCKVKGENFGSGPGLVF